MDCKSRKDHFTSSLYGLCWSWLAINMVISKNQGESALLELNWYFLSTKEDFPYTPSC